MADTGWTNPGTAATSQGLADEAYSNADSIKEIGSLFSASLSTGKFDNGDTPENGVTLKATNFSFAIPDGAVITGIEAKIIGGANIAGEMAYLGILGSPAILPYGRQKTDYWGPTPSEDQTFIWGNPNDLWGTSDLTPAIVNNSLFGWVFMVWDSTFIASSNIDSMQMKVHYEPSQVAAMMGAGF